jgi:hypothetical protein
VNSPKSASESEWNLTGLRENAGPFFVGQRDALNFSVNFGQGAIFLQGKTRKNFLMRKRAASLRLQPARLPAKLGFALVGLTPRQLPTVYRAAFVS